MAKKILNVATFGLAGSLLGKKKSATAASTATATAASTGSRPKPIITPLGGVGGLPPRPANPAATLLSGYSSKLGS